MTWNWFFYLVLCLTFFVSKFHWSVSNILSTTSIWSKRSICSWSSIYPFFIKSIFPYHLGERTVFFALHFIFSLINLSDFSSHTIVKCEVYRFHRSFFYVFILNYVGLGSVVVLILFKSIQNTIRYFRKTLSFCMSVRLSLSTSPKEIIKDEQSSSFPWDIVLHLWLQFMFHDEQTSCYAATCEPRVFHKLK